MLQVFYTGFDDLNMPNKYCVHNCYYIVIFQQVLFNPFLFYVNQPIKTGSNHTQAYIARAGRSLIKCVHEISLGK